MKLPGLIAGLVACLVSAPVHAQKQPNILVVLADDLGFSDLGCYGGEIETPTLDRLAAGGVRFTQFYNTAKCHSSRVSLLTGRWCRQAGNIQMRRAMTIPEVLAPAGYFTAMTGKWHLADQPTDYGFYRYFGHLSGATNYYRGDETFRLNGAPWTVPSSNFYTTVADVDFALDFIQQARAEKKPWFVYIAFNAPHAPLQPLATDYKKYLGRYDGGWEAVRNARLEKQRRLGLFGRDVEPAPRPDHIPPWEQLTPDLREKEARRMAASAALIDRVDQELGRLVANLEAKDELNDTLIVFVSDNGACPFGRLGSVGKKEPYASGQGWDDSTGWAWARNCPFRYYKQNQYEGGIATPALFHWPHGIQRPAGSLVHAPAHLVDLLPTFAEASGATIPESLSGRDLAPLAGVSLLPVLRGQALESRPPIHLLYHTDRGLRDGDWKLVSFQSQPWELYNLAEDRTELHDVAAAHPEIVERMAGQWHEMAASVLHALPKERVPVAETATPRQNKRWSNYTGAPQNDQFQGEKGR